MRLRTKRAVTTFLFLIFLFVATSDGVKFCGRTLGVGRHLGHNMIPDKQMTASSEDPHHPPSSGRLRDIGWAPESLDKDPYPYLQIDLKKFFLICGFKIQGCKDFKGGPAWVTRYRVQVSPERKYWDSWNYIKPEFYGGKNATEIVYRKAEERKVGQFIRIFPMTFENAACMKVELYGELYITDKVPALELDMPSTMSYKKHDVENVEDAHVTLKSSGYEKKAKFYRDYAKVIPAINPVKTELKVDTCVLAPELKGDETRYKSGRVHEVEDDLYHIEWLEDVKSNFAKEKKKLHTYKIHELYAVFSAWCKIIDFSARVNPFPHSAAKLCLGYIVRVDSRLVFQTKGSGLMSRIGYKEQHRPPVSDYVSSEPVLQSKVTPGETELYYTDSLSCLSKGTVTTKHEQINKYTIDGKAMKESRQVRYSSKRGFEKCGQGEKHCQDSRIPYKVNRRKCPILKTWNGQKCIDEDECNNGFAACGLRATCKNTARSYKCVCPKGFNIFNPRAEFEKCQDIDECKKKQCHRDAICHNTPGNFSCYCRQGYTGDGHKSCHEIDECKFKANQETCKKFKHAMCKNTPGSFHCECKPGFYGKVKNCEDVNECSSTHNHKCSPHADCTNTFGSYKCKCKTGFSGDGKNCKHTKKCDERLKTDKCHQNARCVDISGGSECKCKKGYSGDGVNSCKNINECKTGDHKCVQHAECTDNIGSYSCKCKKGYTGDARKECIAIPECMKKFPKCDVKKTATCEEVEKGEYICRCKDGYTGNGEGPCTDIDECTKGKCADDADCENTDGGYSCSCKEGFQGNGTYCSEVDECKDEAACAKKAKCTNTRGSYRCMCNKGYNGNPYNVCDDVDECKLMNCGYGQNCTNTPGSYDCSCAKGFLRDVNTGLCKDIDECATISSPCGTYNYLSCENEPGTYLCRCKMGYKFNIKERKCEDINECKEKSACADHAKCTNAEGSYSCICAKGYSGDGLNFCEHAHKSSTNKAVNAWKLLFASLSTVLVLVPLKT